MSNSSSLQSPDARSMRRRRWALLFASLVLASCGGGGSDGAPPPPAPPPPPAASTFHIGGTVSGLSSGSLNLTNKGGDTLAVLANGSFTFATPLAAGAAYEVAVATQPTLPPQLCSVSLGSGTVGSTDVSSVRVQCVAATAATMALHYEPANVREARLSLDLAGSVDPLLRFEVLADGKLLYCCELWGPAANGHREWGIGDQFSPFSNGPHAFVARLKDADGKVVLSSGVTAGHILDNKLFNQVGPAPDGSIGWSTQSGQVALVSYSNGAALLHDQPAPLFEVFGMGGTTATYFSTEGTPTGTAELTQTVTVAFPGVSLGDTALYIGGWLGDTGSGRARLEYTLRGLNPDGSTFTMKTVTLQGDRACGVRAACLSRDTRYGLIPLGTQFIDLRLLLDAGTGAAFADNLFVSVLPWPH